jgi:hypothetical protein
VYPDKGTVSFSAGLHAWAFTLTTFAQMYAAKFGTDEQKMMEKLWGDNFFDPATKKWTKKATDSKTCQRGFVQFCYNPIKQVGLGGGVSLCSVMYILLYDVHPGMGVGGLCCVLVTKVSESCSAQQHMLCIPKKASDCVI